MSNWAWVIVYAKWRLHFSYEQRRFLFDIFLSSSLHTRLFYFELTHISWPNVILFSLMMSTFFFPAVDAYCHCARKPTENKNKTETDICHFVVLCMARSLFLVRCAYQWKCCFMRVNLERRKGALRKIKSKKKKQHWNSDNKEQIVFAMKLFSSTYFCIISWHFATGKKTTKAKQTKEKKTNWWYFSFINFTLSVTLSAGHIRQSIEINDENV